MIILLFLLCIFKDIHFTTSVCTNNPFYGNAQTSIYDVFLCINMECTSKTQTLKHNQDYRHCAHTGKTDYSILPRMKILLISKTTLKGLVEEQCLDKQGTWKKIDKNFECYSRESLKFTSHPNIKDYQVYVVWCDEQSQEMPDEGNPRVQIVGYDTIDDALDQRPLQMFPTQETSCVSNCMEQIPVWTVNSGGHLIHISSLINATKIIVKDKSSGPDIITLVSVNCSIPTTTPKVLSFYIADFFNYSLTESIDGKPRKPVDLYDAGESVSCRIFGINTKKNCTGSMPQTNIALIEKNAYGQVGRKLTLGTQSTITIPENLTVYGSGLGALCYLGNYESNNSYEYFEAGIVHIKIGTRYVTKLTYLNQPVYSDEYDFTPGSTIVCDRDYYQNMTKSYISTLLLYVIYTTNTSYPLSVFSNYMNRQFVNSSYNGQYVVKKIGDLKMYAFCLVNGDLSTPVQFFAGDRPKVTIQNIHPAWPTNFSLATFTYICNGSFIDDLTFVCTDCLPGLEMDVEKVDAQTFRLTVPRGLRKNVDVNYRCTGYSTKYESITKELNLHVIVTEITDISGFHEFFYYGQDYMQCISSFAYMKGGLAVKGSIVLPAQLQVDGAKTINEDGKKQSILVIKDNNKYIDPNTLISFQACCPTYGSSKYSCLGQWRPLNVARDYHVEYNLVLDNVFPGNILKCMICMNFTQYPEPKKCDGENKLNSKIRIRIINPDGTVNITDFMDEVRAPVEGLKPDGKTYYKITDYDVAVGCQCRGNMSLTKVTMKSCNMNPPIISINPPDKTMFVVGDIFSCTTDDPNCKNGLAYTIYVQRGVEPAEKKDLHSFTLTKKHAGNNIKITCAAGPENSGERKVAYRMIRIEIGPYNVSISNVLPVMTSGQYLKCQSLGFPPASIIWTQPSGRSQLRVSENFLLIGPWDYSGNYTIQCEAKNKRGSVTKIASFMIFNPRITYASYNPYYYLFVPLMTLFYIVLLCLSLLFIFQENVFGVPFFSRGGKMTRGRGKPKPSPIVRQKLSERETGLSTQQGDDADLTSRP